MTNAIRDLLEQHFDNAFAAPDGVAKLRELILTLAMQGKLVEQKPTDQPATELLIEIEAEKQRLVRANKIKAPKPLQKIKPEEIPHELPEGWVWVRLGEIGVINPRNDAVDSAKAGFVPMPLIPEGYSEKHRFEEHPWGEIKKGYTHFADGDIGMAKITPCFENGKSCVFSGLPNGIGAGTTELHIFRNSFHAVVPRFLLYYLKNPHYIAKTVPNMTGSAGQKRVPTPYFTNQPFPLPPLPEQRRIVARIDQLMTRCDALVILRKEREEKRIAVHTASIQQLLATPSRTTWHFIEQHFRELYSVRENVAELRKTILQLAVMGKLVTQDPNDPPASELLKEIESEKRRLVKEGKIKTLKPLPPVADEEKPYVLPHGWEWVRLGALGYFLGGKTPSTSNESFWGGCIPWVSPKDMKVSRIRTAEDSVTELGLRSGLALIPRNSILMVVRSGILRRCFPVAINEVECTINQDLKALVPFLPRQAGFLFLMFRGLESYILSRFTKKGVTVESVVFDDFSNAAFPLPPLPEQKRIVAKIDQLMALCDSLDQQIDTAAHKQAQLLNALMAQV